MAGNKPTAVHFSLIFFVMATIVAGVMAYMSMEDARELRAQLETDRKDKELQKTAAQKYNLQVAALKTKIGYDYPEVGEADPAQPNTVLNAMSADIENYSLTKPGDYKTALREVKDALLVERTNLAQEQSTTKQLNNTISTLKVDYDKKVQDYDAERSTAVDARLKAEGEHTLALQAKDDQYTKLNQELQRSKVQMLEAKNAHDQAIVEKDDRINRLVAINDILQDRIKKATESTFERPDGLITWVDNTSHLVWINLGSADNLAKQTNFSVYRQGNRGVGRDSKNTLKGPEDLKGAIEVTRILGPHRSEARILDEDYFEPIGANDLIYTPIWGPNQTESFAFIGLIDVDNDGRSDRDYLHDVLSSANATVHTEIDDDGNRTGPAIDERTKFLVVGEIPKLEELADEKAKDAVKRMLEHHKTLKDEAREQGVRVVTLNDFLAFIGVRPQQRVFRPGDNRPFNLRNGAQSTATSETIGRSRESSGQTSGVYSKSKRLRQPTSSGQTSGAYSGNK
jgi:hypothetical protein